MQRIPVVILLAVIMPMVFSAGSCVESQPKQTDSTPASFGFGRTASANEIALKDIDVRPDGKGLPPGEGTVAEGKLIYARKCAACHGITGREGPFNVLVMPDSLNSEGDDEAKVKTIGNYWPYASTLYDYINRAMPFNEPGSLKAGEVYSLTAYLLFANKIIDQDTKMNSSTLPKVSMPALPRFVTDNRRGGNEIR